jgi:hypothetical protein
MIVFDQLQAALKVAPTKDAADGFLAQPNNPYFALLDRLYGEDYQLGRLLDTSDLIVHAEGPSLADALPVLRATTWLCTITNKQLRRLAGATMDLAADDSRRRVERAIDLRLTGIAPGSLYAGFLLIAPEAGLLEGVEDPAYSDAKQALQGLPMVSRFVGDEAMLPGFAEAIPDPALRDASVVAAYSMAPTGKIGIHTLELSVPGERPSTLGQRERVVLRDAMRRPDRQATKPGRFVGEVREMDMDKTRFHLRHVAGVGTLRCVLPDVDRESAKTLIGETVAVSGRYATDGEGRPRLLLIDGVEAIHVIDEPKQRAFSI